MVAGAGLGLTVTRVIEGPELMGVPALPPPPQPVATRLSPVPINSADAQARFLTRQIRKRSSNRQVPRAKPPVIFQALFIALHLTALRLPSSRFSSEDHMTNRDRYERIELRGAVEIRIRARLQACRTRTPVNTPSGAGFGSSTRRSHLTSSAPKSPSET
jgi:hypothetical protein